MFYFIVVLSFHEIFSPRREVSLVRSRHAIMETMWTLIRRRAPWRLICVYTVCLSWSRLWICHFVFWYHTFVEKKSTLFWVRTSLTKFNIMLYNSVILASKEIDCMAMTRFLVALSLHDPKKVKWNLQLNFIECPIIKHLILSPTGRFVTILSPACLWRFWKMSTTLKPFGIFWQNFAYALILKRCSPRDCQMPFGIGRGVAEVQILKKWK